MVTESDRDSAFATLLIEQVEATPATQRIPLRTSSLHADHVSRERWRVGVITGSVLVVVVAASLIVLALVHPPVSPSPAQTATGIMPTPGQVLAVLSSKDGQTQTRPINANGTAIEIAYRCTGVGSISIEVPRGPNVAASQCDGAATVGSQTGLNGTVSLTVTATGTVTWTATVRAIEPDHRSNTQTPN